MPLSQLCFIAMQKIQLLNLMNKLRKVGERLSAHLMKSNDALTFSPTFLSLFKEGKIRFIGGDQGLLSLNIFLYDRYYKFPAIMINLYRVIA